MEFSFYIVKTLYKIHFCPVGVTPGQDRNHNTRQMILFSNLSLEAKNNEGETVLSFADEHGEKDIVRG